MNSFVLVTGSTSGIGLEISKYFASKGYNLILTARRENILNDLKKNLSLNYGILVNCIPADLSLRGSPEKIYKFCESKGYSIEILVNNAIIITLPLLQLGILVLLIKPIMNSPNIILSRQMLVRTIIFLFFASFLEFAP